MKTKSHTTTPVTTTEYKFNKDEIIDILKNRIGIVPKGKVRLIGLDYKNGWSEEGLTLIIVS